MIIVIDDERTFVLSDAVQIYLRNENDALSFLARIWTGQWLRNESEITALYLDHDLGSGGTIDPILDFMVLCSNQHAPLLVGTIYVHTMNPVGSHKIVKTLKNAMYPRVQHIPLPPFTPPQEETSA